MRLLLILSALAALVSASDSPLFSTDSSNEKPRSDSPSEEHKSTLHSGLWSPSSTPSPPSPSSSPAASLPFKKFETLIICSLCGTVVEAIEHELEASSQVWTELCLVKFEIFFVCHPCFRVWLTFCSSLRSKSLHPFVLMRKRRKQFPMVGVGFCVSPFESNCSLFCCPRCSTQ